jgi:hypothetical protein
MKVIGGAGGVGVQTARDNEIQPSERRESVNCGDTIRYKSGVSVNILPGSIRFMLEISNTVR